MENESSLGTKLTQPRSDHTGTARKLRTKDGSLGIADWSIGEEVDNGYAWRHLMQHRLHLARIGAVQPEICEQHDQVINSSADPDTSWLTRGRLGQPPFEACPPGRGSGPRNGKGQIGQHLLVLRCHRLAAP